MNLQNILWVFIGGGLGSALRFLISKYLNPLFTNVFLGTLTVNIIGSFLIGCFIAFEQKESLHKPLSIFLITGFCGGFTTFSAFSLETFYLLKSNQYLQVFLYILSIIILSILAVGLGYVLIKKN